MKIREISTKEIMGVFILFFFVFHFRKDKREQEILYEPRGGGEEEIHPTLAMFSFFFCMRINSYWLLLHFQGGKKQRDKEKIIQSCDSPQLIKNSMTPNSKKISPLILIQANTLISTTSSISFLFISFHVNAQTVRVLVLFFFKMTMIFEKFDIL